MSEFKASQGFTDLSQKQANKKAKPVLPLLYLKLETQLSLGFSLIFVLQVKPKIKSLSSNQKYTPPQKQSVFAFCVSVLCILEKHTTQNHTPRNLKHFCIYFISSHIFVFTVTLVS